MLLSTVSTGATCSWKASQRPCELSGLVPPTSAPCQPPVSSKCPSRCVCLAGIANKSSSVLPADHPEGPFDELDMYEFAEGMGRLRLRQHVNPLMSSHQQLAPPLCPQDFGDNSRPLVVDLGCGPGRFVLLMARRQQQALQQQRLEGSGATSSNDSAELATFQCAVQQPHGKQQATSHQRTGLQSIPALKQGKQRNFLGVELRKPLVERAQSWAGRLGLERDTHFVYANATVSLQNLLSGYPGTIETICIQFPDPHFKRRNHKRRIFQPALVHAITTLLPPGGYVFLQSDVEEVAIAMRDAFERHAADKLRPSPEHHEGSSVFFAHPMATGASTSAKGSTAGAAVASSSSSSAALASPGHSELVQQHKGIGDLTTNHRTQPTKGRAETGQAAGGGEGTDEDGGHSEKGSVAEDDGFEPQWAKHGWLTTNPMGVPTEREHYVLQQGLPVYRVLLQRF